MAGSDPADPSAEWEEPPSLGASQASAQPVSGSPVREETHTPLRARTLFKKASDASPAKDEDDEKTDMSKALLILADLQKTVVEKVTQSSTAVASKKNLGSVKLQEFKGGKSVSTKEYRQWKKLAMAHMKLHGLSDSEMALLIYLSVQGEAKECLEILEVSDLLRADGLTMVWKLLDQSHEQLGHERMEDAFRKWEEAHRKPGQTMDHWLNLVYRFKTEVEANDPEVNISSRQIAEKMLRGSGLSREKRAQALFNCGGKYDPKRLEVVLRVTHSEIHLREQRISGPYKSQARQRSDRRPFRKVYEVHEADNLEVESDWEPEEDEDDPSEELDGQDEEQQQIEAEEEPSEHSEPEEEVLDEETVSAAFRAGWRAKQKTAETRKAPGFSHPKGSGRSSSSSNKGRGSGSQSVDE